LDRRKVWKSAERLLKQGKVQAALDELKKVSKKSEGDVVVLNRLADLLAQQGKSSEAIGYYTKIAARFEDGGFIPKAIAIHTKILRLSPDWNPSLIQLGDLYSRQNLHGEARKYLLHAANTFLKANDLEKARGVFEKLVEGEPDNFRHNLRLAETVAASGENEQAIELLLHAGYQALESDEVPDAAKIFARAAELGCTTSRLSVGSARCHEALGENEQAHRLLKECGEREDGGAAVIEMARIHLVDGDCSQAMPLMRVLSAADGELSQWVRLMQAALAAQAAVSVWDEIDAAIERSGGYRESRVLRLLDALAGLEESGHVPALKRLAEAYQSRAELNRAVPAIDALVRACRAQGLDEEADAALERMRSVAPADEEPRVSSGARATLIEPTSLTEPTPTQGRSVATGAIDMATLAVPSDPADEEFCAGRLTQAEVLEKYDLSSQALEQLDEILARFPGHAEAHSHRVVILRDLGSEGDVAQGLAQLAMAQLSAGQTELARSSAEEALASTALLERTRARLIALELVDSDGHETLAQPEVAEAALPLPVAPVEGLEQTSLADPPSSTPTPDESPQSADGGDSEILIDLDVDADSADADVVPQSPVAAPSGIPVPSADLLEEVRAQLRAGDLDAARTRLDTLCEQGFAGPEMGRLRRELEEARCDDAVIDQPPAPVEAGAVSQPKDDADEDLMAIQAALEGEMLGGVDMQPIVPEEPDEDVGQILEAFKQRVAEDVDPEDHRTHYDLGIGFKEMGLLDEAISEFQHSLEAPGLQVESATMLALCHRDREEWGEAEKWYRTAVEQTHENAESARLRYDMAEVMLLAGNAEGALSEFRDLLAADPSYRDVGSRVNALESQLQT